MAVYDLTHTAEEIDDAVELASGALPKTGGSVTGALNISGNVGIGTTSPGVKLHIVSQASGWAQHIYNTNGTKKGTFYICNGTGHGMYLGTSETSSSYYVMQLTSGMTGDGSGGTAIFRVLADGKVGIGTGSNTPSSLLHVNGVVTCTSVTQTSDESKKEKIDDISISAEEMAAAPDMTFKWKEGGDEDIHGGTIAQYWEKITPYYVHGDDCKTLEYSNLAMSCVISLAKEVVALKEENAMLKNELAELKAMIDELKSKIV